MSKHHPVAELDDDLVDDDVVLDDDPDLLGPPDPVWRRRTAIEMVVSGLLGLIASFVLSVEALTLAGDPDASASCDLNDVISCSTVAKHWAASLFGFPNAYLGIAAESVVLTVAVALVGGVVFPRWYMRIAQVVYTLGLVFAWWLFGMAYFVIGALCPWCLLITVTTTLVWVGLTRINVRDGNLPAPAGARRFVAAGYDWYVTAGFCLLLVVMIVLRYGALLFS